MLHDLSPENLRLLYFTGCVAGAVTIVMVFLALLVRFTVFFALLGAAGVIASVSVLPKGLADQISGYVLVAGIGLFVVVILAFEFVQWRRHQRMLNVRSQFLINGWQARGRALARARAHQTRRRP